MLIEELTFLGKLMIYVLTFSLIREIDFVI